MSAIQATWSKTSQWIKAPLTYIERAAKEKLALCVNAAGELSLRDKGYVAISHVWEEGIQADSLGRGISQPLIAQIFAKLAFLHIQWIWLDGIAIPGTHKTLTVHEEELKKDIINNLGSTYRNADLVIVFDALVMQLKSTSLLDVAVILLCGKWMIRVWTFQEICLAKNALIVTACGAVDFREMVKALRSLSGNSGKQISLLGDDDDIYARQKFFDDVSADRYEQIYLRYVRLILEDGKHPTLTALALSCHGRQTGNDVDYARAFFPVLGLTWQTRYTRDEGMHAIYESQSWYAKRLLLMHGVPRSSFRPGWAPAYLTGLEGPILSPENPLGDMSGPNEV